MKQFAYVTITAMAYVHDLCQSLHLPAMLLMVKEVN